MQITEDNFIEELKKGNEKALEYVIDNYGWILKTVIKKHLRYLPDYYEECLNDCLMSIWTNIGYYDSQKSSFKNWVGGVAKYKSINYVRKYLRDLEKENIEDIAVSAEDNALKAVLSKEISQETERMLKCLSEEDRKIFMKLYFEDKSMDEISCDTGLAKPVLYNRLSRGKKKMRKVFELKGGLGQ
ncbi:sigma-70 family RNA polymerase sigma factor [Tepidanaerobacter sp. GT38]|uniref:sigma-70 family RNA polymerase sigma factor n=1 Tax=Tepidanaerobacter sp. GT38 TaxID=2722793 RepID=UPI001F022EDC|nr:sigma-70 family RNA polymerase sigma factor [Tepidanaerobacter sp. GT38]MCG1011067.1 sigma-70 family RNA polymerase sigma factor [Tepidanaerobacter sp. GT38]